MWKCAANFAQSSAETFALTSHKAGRETMPLPVVCALQWLYSAQPDPQESASLSVPKHLHVLPRGKPVSGQESLTHTAQQCPRCGTVLAGGWGADLLQNSQMQDTKHINGSVFQIPYLEYHDHKQETDPWPLSASWRQLKQNLREEWKEHQIFLMHLLWNYSTSATDSRLNYHSERNMLKSLKVQLSGQGECVWLCTQ